MQKIKKAIICLCLCALVGSSLLSCASDGGKTAETTTASTVSLPDENKKESITDGTFTYDLYVSYAEVTGYLGADEDVNIPAEVNGLPVMSIGKSAFALSSTVKRVFLPDTITNIANYAFNQAASLEDINLPQNLISVGNYAFRGCSLTEVILPDSLTNIGKYAFAELKITDVTLPPRIAKIGDYAFSGNTLLTSYTLPEGLSKIANRMFYGCTALTEITIPEHITELDDYAFSGCSSMTSIFVPATVTTLGEGVFINCPNLVIKTTAGSETEKYAVKYKLNYEVIETEK